MATVTLQHVIRALDAATTARQYDAAKRLARRLPAVPCTRIVARVLVDAASAAMHRILGASAA